MLFRTVLIVVVLVNNNNLVMKMTLWPLNWSSSIVWPCIIMIVSYVHYVFASQCSKRGKMEFFETEVHSGVWYFFASQILIVDPWAGLLVRLFCWLLFFSAGLVGPAQTSMWLLFQGVFMNERASSEWQTSHVSVGDRRTPLIVWLQQEECFTKLVPAAGLVFVCVCFIPSESELFPHRWYLMAPRLYPQCSRGAVRPVCPMKQLRVHSSPLIHSQQLLFCHSQHRDAEKRAVVI